MSCLVWAFARCWFSLESLWATLACAQGATVKPGPWCGSRVIAVATPTGVPPAPLGSSGTVHTDFRIPRAAPLLLSEGGGFPGSLLLVWLKSSLCFLQQSQPQRRGQRGAHRAPCSPPLWAAARRCWLPGGGQGVRGPHPAQLLGFLAFRCRLGVWAEFEGLGPILRPCDDL